jgi:type VI secretion system protein VasG
MEKHHKVRISDAAIVAAVNLSARYIPARQLPDKAVSLLDTACARVAISQAAVPARIADLKESIAALQSEIAGKSAQTDLGEDESERIEEATRQVETLTADLAAFEEKYASEKAIVDDILRLREAAHGEAPTEEARAELHEAMGKLDAINPDERMVYPHVDEQAVASVISDWTGIPAGRMVADELQQVLKLADTLKERVIGQDHGLTMIAKRIETARAGLANPQKPIGVFMLCGPSGVGKTETALALAEAIYGGEQNIITINMSEFQEAHTVSLLKGAPPGYVGYGEGGRLTEAVRRKPYSVVLLDEVEKAHPDVHELFFQVFDKGIMEDGNGRPINFKNTVILLTSNVGTDVIMDMADQGNLTPPIEEVESALRPPLQQVFPPALLGRIVTIPYFPLSGPVLEGITKLKLKSVVKRMKGAHGANLTFGPDVLDWIVSQCRDPDSGGRMIDNIITNAILPDLSRQVLGRMVTGEKMTSVTASMQDGKIAYAFA